MVMILNSFCNFLLLSHGQFYFSYFYSFYGSCAPISAFHPNSGIAVQLISLLEVSIVMEGSLLV